MLALEIIVAVVLIAFNGLLALSEIAMVSARPGKLKTMADAGTPGAAAALKLIDDPGRFLSTVQIGITLVGVLAGAFSGTTIGERLGLLFADLGMPASYAQTAGVGVVVVIITYLSVIAGELVPKHIGLRDPERFAAAAAPIMMRISSFAGPVVAVLDTSAQVALRLLGSKESEEAAVTDDDIRSLIAEAETAGVIEPEERSMIAGVMRLGDRQVRAVMTPRRDVDMLNIAASEDDIRKALLASVHTRLPAYRGSFDDIAGVVHAKDLLDVYLQGGRVDVREHIRTAPFVPDSVDALAVLETLKTSAVHLALVHDEYGHFQGIVTTYDILEAIAGTFRTDDGPPEPDVVRRADGSLLLTGSMPVDELAELLAIRLPPDAKYHTLGGLVLSSLGRVPATGDNIVVQGWRLEVVDLDGRRIDKVLAQRAPARHRAA